MVSKILKSFDGFYQRFQSRSRTEWAASSQHLNRRMRRDVLQPMSCLPPAMSVEAQVCNNYLSISISIHTFPMSKAQVIPSQSPPWDFEHGSKRSVGFSQLIHGTILDYSSLDGGSIRFPQGWHGKKATTPQRGIFWQKLFPRLLQEARFEYHDLVKVHDCFLRSPKCLCQRSQATKSKCHKRFRIQSESHILALRIMKVKP